MTDECVVTCDTFHLVAHYREKHIRRKWNQELRNLVAGSPPTDDILLRIDTMIQVIQVHTIGEISFHLTLGFLVRYAKTIGHLDVPLLRGTWNNEWYMSSKVDEITILQWPDIVIGVLDRSRQIELSHNTYPVRCR